MHRGTQPSSLGRSTDRAVEDGARARDGVGGVASVASVACIASVARATRVETTSFFHSSSGRIGATTRRAPHDDAR